MPAIVSFKDLGLVSDTFAAVHRGIDYFIKRFKARHREEQSHETDDNIPFTVYRGKLLARICRVV